MSLYKCYFKHHFKSFRSLTFRILRYVTYVSSDLISLWITKHWHCFMNIQFIITCSLYHGNMEYPFCPPEQICGHFIPQWVPMGLHNSTEPELFFKPPCVNPWDFSPGCSPFYLLPTDPVWLWAQPAPLIIQSTAKCLRERKKYTFWDPKPNLFLYPCRLPSSSDQSVPPIKICRHPHISMCRAQGQLFSCPRRTDSGKNCSLVESSPPALHHLRWRLAFMAQEGKNSVTRS